MKKSFDIKVAVLEELKWEPLLHGSHIGVFVQVGDVILSGCVDNYRKKFAAQQAVQRVKGISSLVNDISVVLSAKDKRSDVDLAKDINNTLAWHNAIPAGSIHADVKGGRVSLTGNVNLPFQSETAFYAIIHLAGITDIQNLLQANQSKV